jgi:hypothetical protein
MKFSCDFDDKLSGRAMQGEGWMRSTGSFHHIASSYDRCGQIQIGAEAGTAHKVFTWSHSYIILDNNFERLTQ